MENINQYHAEDILKILKDSLTLESQLLLFTLFDNNNEKFISKEKLKELTNQKYSANQVDGQSDIISSRHVLDMHTSRLEGAGLISFIELGRIRLYSITKFGEFFIGTLK